MTFEGSVITEQNVTFGIIIVKPYVLNDVSAKQQMELFGKRAFGNIPIILMAQNSVGTPTYYGRKDIVQFLSHVHPSRIPWKKYTLS